MRTIVLAVMLILAGCGKTFYTSASGENDTIGLKLPVAEEVTIDIAHHLNGSVLSIKDPSEIEHSYCIVNSNNYFGCVFVNEVMRGKVKVKPSQNTTNKQD